MAKLTLTPKGFRATLPLGLPDLIVQSVSMSPAAPNDGDHVVFSAVVKNQGDTATPSATGIGILFSIDGNPVNWTTDTTGALAAGATRTLTATNGTSGGNYWAATAGSHTLLVNVNDQLTISETVTVNDTLTASVSVTNNQPPPPVTGYGPTASTWLSFGTPDDWKTPYATVSSLSAALSAAASAPDGAMIVLTAGSYGAFTGPSTSNRATPVVICAAPHQPVTFSTVDFNGSDIALARFTHTSSLHFNPGASNAECAVFRTQSACFVKSAQNIRVAGQVQDQTLVTNGDRWHVNSDDITAPGGIDLREFYWGVLQRVTGGTGHVDQIQADAGTDVATGDGTFMVRLANGFIAAAVASGVNGFQFKADQQPAGYTYGLVVIDNLWSVDAGGGQGDASNQSGPTNVTDSVFESYFRFNDATLVTATGNTFAANSTDSRWPSNHYGDLGGLTRPVFDIPALLSALGLT